MVSFWLQISHFWTTIFPQENFRTIFDSPKFREGAIPPLYPLDHDASKRFIFILLQILNHLF